MRNSRIALATITSLAFASPALAVDWNFYHHQSAPLFATSRGAKMLSEEIEKATNGELKARLHLSGTLQIAGEQHHAGGRRQCRSTRRRPVQFRQHPGRRHSAPAGAGAHARRIQQDRGGAAALSREGVRRKRHRDARRVYLSAPGRLGTQEAHLTRRLQGHEAAHRAARAGRDGAPLRRHVGDDQRAGSPLRARPRRGRRHLHRRRRRGAVEGPAEVRLPDPGELEQLLHHRERRSLQQALARPARQAAQGRSRTPRSGIRTRCRPRKPLR